ncbi:MAG TPA: DUF4142 domain-containing protein [Vicinamibacterales bacterium]|nr:DUF4142 domain-containing protein [Vicinamibacterales bacterium]
MKKVFVFGTAVLMVASSLAAQRPGGAGTTDRQGSTPASQPGTATPGQGGARTGAGDQGGARAGAGDPNRAVKAPAADHAKAPEADHANMPAADHAFVMDAAMGSAAEVELGNLAADKAQGEAVKDFAKRMVADHGRASDELKTLAQTRNLSLPADVGARHKATKDRLSRLSGAAFDRAYMQQMVADHRKDVLAFQKESKTGKDGDVKAWAAKTLPTLQEHLKMAEQASRGAVGTSGTKPDGGKAGASPRTTSEPAGSSKSPRGGTNATRPSDGTPSTPGAAAGSNGPR